MPIRIKPVHDLGPCILTYESIEEITRLVEEELSASLYSAEDGIWEIYDEPHELFLQAIKNREQLDSFTVNATGEIRKKLFSEIVEGQHNIQPSDSDESSLRPIMLSSVDRERTIQQLIRNGVFGRDLVITFNRKEATVRCVIKSDRIDEQWYEHLLSDIKKSIKSPSASQRISALYRKYYKGSYIITGLSLLELFETDNIPYSKIVIKQRPPNPVWEGIKVNILSSIIWMVITFVAGIIFTLAVSNFDFSKLSILP